MPLPLLQRWLGALSVMHFLQVRGAARRQASFVIVSSRATLHEGDAMVLICSDATKQAASVACRRCLLTLCCCLLLLFWFSSESLPHEEAGLSQTGEAAAAGPACRAWLSNAGFFGNPARCSGELDRLTGGGAGSLACCTSSMFTFYIWTRECGGRQSPHWIPSAQTNAGGAPIPHGDLPRGPETCLQIIGPAKKVLSASLFLEWYCLQHWSSYRTFVPTTHPRQAEVLSRCHGLPGPRRH